jgi:hypothetical protein
MGFSSTECGRRMKKADTSNEKFHQEALSALEKYDSMVYTDRSKIGEAVCIRL